MAPADQETAIGAEEVRRIDHEGISAWDRHDPERFAALLADGFEFRDSSLPEPLTTPEQVREYMGTWFTAFPDMRTRTTNRVVSEDSVGAEVEFTGTHTGPLNAGGVQTPATGRTVHSSGTYFARVKEGRIASFSAHPDVMGLMTQLGLAGAPLAAAPQIRAAGGSGPGRGPDPLPSDALGTRARIPAHPRGRLL